MPRAAAGGETPYRGRRPGNGAGHYRPASGRHQCRGVKRFITSGVHEGIRQMFTVIGHARVGFKAIKTLPAGYLNGLDLGEAAPPGDNYLRLII